MEELSRTFSIGTLSQFEAPSGLEDHVKWADQILEDGWLESEKARLSKEKNVGKIEMQVEGFVSGLARADEGKAINHAGSSSQRKEKVVRWTEEEHKAFLVGLEAYGKGSWSTISKVLVPTKTTSQVASHAQKYLRRVHSKTPAQRRRSSIHDTRILDSGAIVQVSPRLMAPTPLPPASAFTSASPSAFASISASDVLYSSTGSRVQSTTTNYDFTPNYHLPFKSAYANLQASSSSIHSEMPTTYPCMDNPIYPVDDSFTDQQHLDFLYMLTPFSPVSYDTYN